MKRALKITGRILLGLLVAAGLLAGYVWYDNSTIDIRPLAYYSAKVPPPVDGYKIAVVTDFHNGKNADRVAKALREAKPQMIAVVGDAVNMYDTDFQWAKKLLSQLPSIAPTYLVAGNHEVQFAQKKELYAYAQEAGVQVLDNKWADIEVNHAVFRLIGYGDMIYGDGKLNEKAVKEQIKTLYQKNAKPDGLNVLLFHRGNLAPMVAAQPFDLVLSGHTHGGLINLPYVKDYILQQRYQTAAFSKGLYRLGQTTVIISGGLEVSKESPRLFNSPEIPIVTLRQIP